MAVEKCRETYLKQQTFRNMNVNWFGMHAHSIANVKCGGGAFFLSPSIAWLWAKCVPSGWIIRFACKLMVSIRVCSFVISFNASIFSIYWLQKYRAYLLVRRQKPQKPFGRISIHSSSRGIVSFIPKISLWLHHCYLFPCTLFGNAFGFLGGFNNHTVSGMHWPNKRCKQCRSNGIFSILSAGNVMIPYTVNKTTSIGQISVCYHMFGNSDGLTMRRPHTFSPLNFWLWLCIWKSATIFKLSWLAVVHLPFSCHPFSYHDGNKRACYCNFPKNITGNCLKLHKIETNVQVELFHNLLKWFNKKGYCYSWYGAFCEPESQFIAYVCQFT